MLSMADAVDGQGVGSAYLELMKLLKEDGKDKFEILLNDKIIFNKLFNKFSFLFTYL